MENHILLVDDEVLINLALSEFLQSAGFAVESAHSGWTAVAAIKHHPPWALVTDLHLGSGPNGFEVARCGRDTCPGLPVVFVSGSMHGRHPHEGVAGSTYLAKPCNGRRVLLALRQAGFLEVA